MMIPDIAFKYTHLILIASIQPAGINQPPMGANDQMTNPRITPCPNTPNCVSSLDRKGDRFVAPLDYEGRLEDAKERLLQVIRSLPRAQVQEDRETYVRVVFTSFLMRFKDDVEFLFDDRVKQVHVKSASRVGYSDLGVNRRRVEKIREHFQRPPHLPLKGTRPDGGPT